jgi:hypothetical protein
LRADHDQGPGKRTAAATVFHKLLAVTRSDGVLHGVETDKAGTRTEW